MSEKQKEKFPMTEHDEIVMMNIYSFQQDFENYKEKFHFFLDDECPWPFTASISK